MFFSLYPTDTDEVRAAVVAAVRDQPGDRLVFTSLHIPESRDLHAFGDYLTRLHHSDGLEFCADISPLTLEALGLGIDELGLLRTWGVRSVRIDFGFDTEQVRRIAQVGPFEVAVNASTADAALLDALDGVPLVGWHNYYPRPETGLSEAFFDQQNALFASRGLAVYSFIPGEVSHRAPLFLGLPTLEGHRHRNAYSTYLETHARHPGIRVVCAEGVLHSEHLRWITHFEQTGEVTLPLVSVDPAVRYLQGRSWRLRPEGTDSSFRIEQTRGGGAPERIINADLRGRGSLQVDLAGYGRYAGEVHLMRRDRPLTNLTALAGCIAQPYLGLVDVLRPGRAVRFEE